MKSIYTKLLGDRNYIVVQLKSNQPGKRSLGWLYGICGSGHRIKQPNQKYDKWMVALSSSLN